MPDNSQKTHLRTQLLQQRNNLSHLELQHTANKITQQIVAWDKFKSAQHIGLYHAFRNEVNLQALWIIAHNLGKKTYFPVIDSLRNNKIMQFLEATPDQDLPLNHFRIKEPFPNSPSIAIENMDCLFIPLVAFDQKGYRLGMGQGYYDRALANLQNKPCCVGIAYSFQEVETLPHDSWDVPLDVIVTEKEIRFF